MLPARYILGGELRVQLGRVSIYFKREGSLVDVYLESPGSVSKITRFTIDRDIEVEVKPLPLGLNSGYKCIMYKLREPIVILPGSRIKLSLSMPYSIGVLAKGTLVTIIEPMRRKLALHGTPTLGELCVYCSEENINQLYWPPGEAPIYVENNTATSTLLSKFIIPINGLSIYLYNEKIYYSPLSIEFTEQLGKIILRVSTSRESPLTGATPIYTGEPSQYIMTV